MVTDDIPDAEILRRLADGEDSFVERKTYGDWAKDVRKVCVAFANSCPIDGSPGLFFIGARNNGEIESPTQDLDKVQKTFEQKISDAYPRIIYRTKIVPTPSGKILTVIVPGSAKGPHFAGPSYVKVGSQIRVASEEEFERIIDRREHKVRELLKWKDKPITMYRLWAVPAAQAQRHAGVSEVLVHDCNRDVLTVEELGGLPTTYINFPLEQVTLSWDARRLNRLAIEVPPA
jgi:hypothetical protein